MNAVRGCLIACAIGLIIWLFLGLAVGSCLAYTVTGGDADGRYATVRNVVNLYPGVESYVSPTLNVRLLWWGYPSAKVIVNEHDGALRMDLNGRAWNPEFSRLVAHELGHVVQISNPGLLAAWQRELTRRGYGPSTWRQYPQAGWWRRSPSEAFAENFCRALYWPWYSPRRTPDTELAWLSRAEMWAFLASVGITKDDR